MATSKKTTEKSEKTETEVEEIPEAYEAPAPEGDPPHTPDRPQLGPDPQ
jgi:hypothetical protein